MPVAALSGRRQLVTGGRYAARMLAVGSFVALGDSFTEGVGDYYQDGASCRGWADRLAELIAARQAAANEPTLRYANLAIRGKLLGQVIEEQVPAALALRPGLVSVAAGGNDLLRPKANPDDLAASFEQLVAGLRGAGCQVLMFTGFDPGSFPLIRLIRGKAAAYNAQLRLIAERYECLLADLWAMRVLADSRMWCEDRLHLAAEGHRRVALRAAEVLGAPVDEDWRAPMPATAAAAPDPRAPVRQVRSPQWLAARRQDARWVRKYASPWLYRRLRGISSGDGMTAKRPDLAAP
jgi:lysophospholipase L1-like esterase